VTTLDGKRLTPSSPKTVAGRLVASSTRVTVAPLTGAPLELSNARLVGLSRAVALDVSEGSSAST
jgi:hypothetical protein